MEVPEGFWETMELGEIFSKTDIKKLREIINKGDLKALKEFLDSRKSELKSKGITSDYLYYYFQYIFAFGKKLKEVM